MAADQLRHEKISMTTDVHFGRRTGDSGAATVLQAPGRVMREAVPRLPAYQMCRKRRQNSTRKRGVKETSVGLIPAIWSTR